MKVIEIPLDQIEVGTRLREIDEDHAQFLAESFMAHGQRTPIEVRISGENGKYRLIAGAHRVRAAEIARHKTVSAIEKRVTDDEAKLLEIDENLVRHDLTALDRATFLAARKAIYEKLHPETVHGGDRRSDQFVKIYDLKEMRFTAATAKRLGISESSVQKAIARHAKIGPELRRLISGTWLANKGVELDALAAIESEDNRRLVVEMLLAEGSKLKSVAAAKQQLPGWLPSTKDKSEEDFDAFRKRWMNVGAGSSKFSAATKAKIVAFIMKEYALEYSADAKVRR